MRYQEIKIFAPATVANVGPGYDILGLALKGLGETIKLSMKEGGQVTIRMQPHIPNIPLKAKDNIAGIVATKMLAQLNANIGLDILIEKNISPGSGLGSSGSSAAGIAFGINKMMGNPFTQSQLLEFAMMGEAALSGKAHADNVAPCLLGGFVLVQSYEPLRCISLDFPSAMHLAIVHPEIEVKTSESKKILKKQMDLPEVTAQAANVAALVAGMARSDYQLIGNAMHDRIAEPIRSYLIPGYQELKRIAAINGAIGASISGSGPSVFAFCESAEQAKKLSDDWKLFLQSTDIASKCYQSQISATGCVVLESF
ncbi:MAG: homoserine kinase [Cyclobacteriaceae bacterium]|nr:homoserine kinase [Cyclobacteriaceae bacterium]MCH8517684.1 homoserine kinase [Cyclobacteriaceae bacterium]